MKQRQCIAKGILLLIVAALASGATGTAASSTSSQTYEQPIGRTWDQTDLLVVVVPPTPYIYHGTHIEDPAFLGAVLDAVAAWEDAMAAHGSSDIASLVFDVRVVGIDLMTPLEAAEADIIIGNTKQYTPVSVGGGAATSAPPAPCLITNLPPVNVPASAFRIAVHEFGHCLGLGHPTGFQPDEDVMAYGDGTCISNLNLLGLHESFAPAFGRTAAASVQLSSDDYERYC